jgi:hypothetical protein
LSFKISKRLRNVHSFLAVMSHYRGTQLRLRCLLRMQALLLSSKMSTNLGVVPTTTPVFPFRCVPHRTVFPSDIVSLIILTSLHKRSYHRFFCWLHPTAPGVWCLWTLLLYWDVIIHMLNSLLVTDHQDPFWQQRHFILETSRFWLGLDMTEYFYYDYI